MYNKLKKAKNLILLTLVTLSFTSCYDFIETYDLSSEKAAIYDVKLDMSALIGMISAFGGETMEKDPQFAPKDTSVYFKSYVDTSSVLTAEQKRWLAGGKVGVQMDIKNEIFKIGMNIPFQSIDDLNKALDSENQANLQAVLTKLMKDSNVPMANGQVSGEEMEMEEDADQMGEEAGTESIEDKLNLLQNIYTTTFKKGRIERKVDPAKLQVLMNNKDFEQMRQISGMVGDMKIQSKFIFPNAVRTVKNDHVEISADKKTVIVNYKFSDLIDNPESGSFLIEY